MLTRYIVIILFCTISNIASGQFIEQQRWRYTSQTGNLDTTVRINHTSVYMPFLKVCYTKNDLEDLCIAMSSPDSLFELIKAGKTSYDSLSPRQKYHFNCIRKFNGYYATKHVFNRWGRRYSMWEIAIGQSNEERGVSSPFYKIYYLKEIGIIAVVPEDNPAERMPELRNYRLLSGRSNISHYKASPNLLKKAWKEITRLNPGLTE